MQSNGFNESFGHEKATHSQPLYPSFARGAARSLRNWADRIAARVLPLVRTHMRGVVTMIACAIYLFPFMRVILTLTDEGTFLCGAVRLLHGQVFARDFAEVMGPATFYFLALFFKAFGATFFVAHLYLFLSWMATTILVYLLCRNVAAPYRMLPLLLIFATCFSSLGMDISHHIDSNCLTLLVVLLLTTWLRHRQIGWLMLSGALVALATLDLQPKGILLLLSAGTWLWLVERKQKNAIRALVHLGIGFVAVLVLTGIYFATKGAFGDLVRASFVWPLQHYSAVNHVPYAYGTFKFNWRGVPLASTGSWWVFLFASVLMIPFLFIDILPGVVVLQILSRRFKSFSAETRLVVLCGFSLWISELHRKDVVHLVFGSPLLIILCIQFLSRSGRLASRLVLTVLTASACTVAACNLLVALLAHPVPTRVGQVHLLEGGPEIAALDEFVGPGEEIFVYPYCPAYYFLTQTTNPTRFSILQSGYNTPAEVREVLRVLATRKVNHVLWDLSFKKSVAIGFPASLHLRDDMAPIDAYLRDHYRTVYADSGFLILERRRDQDERVPSDGKPAWDPLTTLSTSHGNGGEF